MTLDNETKESLQLSFRYLRAYGEDKIRQSVSGWQQIYGATCSESREHEGLSAGDKSKATVSSPPPEVAKEPPVRNKQPPVASEPGDQERRPGAGTGRKIFLSIVLLWIALIIGTLFHMLA